MSTLPLDTDGDYVEFGPNSRKLANTTAPNDTQSSMTTSDVPEDRTILWQPLPTETHVQTVNAGDSAVGVPQHLPWEQMGWASRSGEQTRTTTTIETTSSTSLITTEESMAAANSRVIAALRQGQPHEILSSILQASKDLAFIESLPNTAILQIVRLLDPKVFIEPYKQMYTDLPPSLYLYLARRSGGVPKLLADFKSVYECIVHKVIARRQALGFQKHEMLLKMAAVAGDTALATETWNSMLKREFKPDVECYNHYFEAWCWPKTEKLISPRPFLSESNEETLHVKRIVSRMFTSMIARGVMADANTFGLLMTAYSRGGDLGGVKVILKKVWGIDVDAIMDIDDNSRSVDDLPPDSALHPTPDLLFAIAHVFGSTKNLAVGLRLIHHISCRFSVPIEDRTWRELLKWTFILSRHSSLKHRYVEFIPPWTVEVLWQTMISTHKPSMQVLNHVLKMFYWRRILHAALRVMILGLLLRKESQATYFRSVGERNKPSDNSLVQFSLSALQYKNHLESLENERDIHWINGFVQQILKKKRWFSDPEIQILRWERQKITEVVHLCWPYRAPMVALEYPINSGTVIVQYSTSLRMQCRDFDLNEYLEKEIDDPDRYRRPLD